LNCNFYWVICTGVQFGSDALYTSSVIATHVLFLFGILVFWHLLFGIFMENANMAMTDLVLCFSYIYFSFTYSVI